MPRADDVVARYGESSVPPKRHDCDTIFHVLCFMTKSQGRLGVACEGLFRGCRARYARDRRMTRRAQIRGLGKPMSWMSTIEMVFVVNKTPMFIVDLLRRASNKAISCA